MIGGRSAETIRVVRDRIDDCKQPRCRNVKITLAAAGPSIDVSGPLVRRCMAAGHSALRGSGPGQDHAFKRCSGTSQSPWSWEQPASASRAVRPPNRGLAQP